MFVGSEEYTDICQSEIPVSGLLLVRKPELTPLDSGDPTGLYTGKTPFL